MRKLKFLPKTLLASILCVSVLSISCSDDTEDVEKTVEETVEETKEEVSIQSAIYSSYNNTNSSTSSAYYYLGADYNPEINIEGYNEDYTYELKLKGRYLGEEYTLNLTKVDTSTDADVVISKGEVLVSLTAPTKDIEEEETTTSLEIDITELDLEIDEYSAVVVEVESEEEISIASNSNISEYTTYLIDRGATNFLSGTQVESTSYVKLTELNLNSHTTFAVRPSIVNYINKVSVGLGVYNLEGEKLGVASSNGSSGSVSKGTYLYRFPATDVDDLITETGEYLLRLEEREFSADAADKVYKKGLFQKIKITKVTTYFEAE